MVMEVRDPLLRYDDPNDGQVQKILKNVKRSWLAFAGGKEEGERLPWFFADDCDKRGLEVQRLAYKGGTPVTLAPRIKGLEKVGNFIVYHDSLPYVIERDTYKKQRDQAEEKLALMEEKGIDLDRIDTHGKETPFAPLSWKNPLVILMALAVILFAFFFGVTVIGPALFHPSAQSSITTTSTAAAGIPQLTKRGKSVLTCRS
jgi:hypothetical protein